MIQSHLTGTRLSKKSADTFQRRGAPERESYCFCVILSTLATDAERMKAQRLSYAVSRSDTVAGLSLDPHNT